MVKTAKKNCLLPGEIAAEQKRQEIMAGNFWMLPEGEKLTSEQIRTLIRG